jgi:hypothetical protein
VINKIRYGCRSASINYSDGFNNIYSLYFPGQWRKICSSKVIQPKKNEMMMVNKLITLLLVIMSLTTDTTTVEKPDRLIELIGSNILERIDSQNHHYTQ